MLPLMDTLRFEQRESLEQRFPALRALRLEYLALCAAAADALICGTPAQAQAQQARDAFYAQMDARQRDILRQNGIDPRQLVPDVACEACQDKGYVLVEGEKQVCECRLRAAHQKALERQRQLPSFSQFDEALFDDGAQRTSARNLSDHLQQYAKRYPRNDKPNLLLFGNTGLGKTFFLGCLTRALLEREKAATMISAYDMFDGFRRQHMGEGALLEQLIRVPFLALDDLGSEPMYRNITIEYLGALLDARLTHKRPTAIATNLTRSELAARYGERITSRLYHASLFDVIGLRGEDLRRKRT